MKLNELTHNIGAKKTKLRRGRGIGTGRGKTSGRGHKGYKARSGANRVAYEGGQNPIHMRLPKRGFSNISFKKKYVILNVGKLQQSIDLGLLPKNKTIDARFLKNIGVINRIHDGLTILAKGTIKDPIMIEAARASKHAIAMIEGVKGKILVKGVEGQDAKEILDAQAKALDRGETPDEVEAAKEAQALKDAQEEKEAKAEKASKTSKEAKAKTSRQKDKKDKKGD